MKPTVKKLKDVRGRITAYSAKIGPIEAHASTPQEATEACERAALDALARLDTRGWFGHAWGRAYCVWAHVDGWSYAIDGFSPGYTVTSRGTREDAIDGAIVHLGQNAWTSDTNDDEFLRHDGVSYEARRTLASWIGFQRAFLVAPKDERDPHRWACERASVHAPKVEVSS